MIRVTGVSSNMNDAAGAGGGLPPDSPAGAGSGCERLPVQWRAQFARDALRRAQADREISAGAALAQPGFEPGQFERG
jgi:hypothetical protein